MIASLRIAASYRRIAGTSARFVALAGLALSAASCVPATISRTPAVQFDRPLSAARDAQVPSDAMAEPLQPTAESFARNAAIPVATAPNPAARGISFDGRTPIDGLRSLHCLAEAVYYEARSEGEAGQRAVAQVVLNRVRHPAWPNSVCGVVYQGPLRQGGGCQFTFTCDGSLGRSPAGAAWAEARRIAREALGGSVYAPVGHSTHYHTHAVLPPWHRGLLKTAVIGAHNFYRMPGSNGAPTAFRAAYSGIEPLALPAARMPAPAATPPNIDLASSSPTIDPIQKAMAAPSPEPFVRYTERGASASRVREEYRASGEWRADAPATTAAR